MNLYKSRVGLLALLGFIIALAFFLWVVFNFLIQTTRPEIASAPTPTPSRAVTSSPTATRAIPSPTPTASVTSTATRVAPTSTQVAPATSAPTTQPTLASTRAPTATPTPSDVQPITPLPKQTYTILTILSPVTDRPAASHADLNFALRGYAPTKNVLQLIDLPGATDARAPQLSTLFADGRIAGVKAVYQVNNWDWGCNCHGKPIDDPEVTLVGLGATLGETLHVPSAGYDIGNGNQVMVLYADADSITLGYTRNDNITSGYAIHVEGIIVAPDLVAFYQQINNTGRKGLPALRANQAFGQARTTEVKVAIRDTGEFMDPRSRKDWWRKPVIQPVRPGPEGKGS